MSNPMQNLHTLGLNPFAVTLLAESMLKSAYVKNCGTKPLTFEFPVRRSDCEGWAGVRITIEAVPASGVSASDGWRPIDTVPKDGREVILREGNRVGAACWIKWPDTYDRDGAPNADGGEGWTVGYDGDEWRAPDAWQPMPPAHGVDLPDGAKNG